MSTEIRSAFTRCLLLGFLLCLPQRSSAQERLCDPSFEDCYTPLIDLVNAETVGIDMEFYMIELPGLASAVISRYQAGVPVRLIVEPRANLKFPMNQPLLDQFRAAGIPMRYKLGNSFVHSKVLLLAGQGKVVFTGSNFGEGDVGPYQPYQNYVDGAWYISDDPAVVNSFKTRYDDNWTDTTLYGNYANINGPLSRRYPTFPIDPAVNLLPNQNPAEDYGARTIALLDRETQRIDLTMYRITEVSICDALLRAVARGVPVRLLAEPLEYRFDSSRLGAEFTGPYNIDRLYAAGVQIKMRQHLGLNHQKSVQLYGQGMTIFGSSNWSLESFNYQEEHNYFTTKPWFFQWFVNQFDRKWNSPTEYQPFVPLPPDPPTNLSPADWIGVGAGSVTLRWEGGGWAHKYDIYFGTNPNNLPRIATDVITGTLGPSGSESYVVSGLQNGQTYYWSIVGKTMANQVASGPIWRFVVTGSASPPAVTGVSPNSGTTSGGTSVTIAGSNFLSGASVSFGGSGATNVGIVNASTLTAITPAHAAGAVNVVVTNPDNQSGTLTNGYTYVSPPSTETVLLADDFNDNALDQTKWDIQNLFSGYTDTSLPVNESSQSIRIGPLLQNAGGSHYRGIRSVSPYDFTGAYGYVEAVQVVASTTGADAMFTIGRDVDNYYRIYVEGGVLIGQKKIGGGKANLFTAAYNPTSDRYWRIRHDVTTGRVVFETAPDNAGVPGAWTPRYSEAWNTVAIPLGSIAFEVKAGTWQSEANAAGTVVFDNFKAARP